MEAHIGLAQPMAEVPPALADFHLELLNHGKTLCYHAESLEDRHTGLARLVQLLTHRNLEFTTIDVKQSSLEDIFVRLIEGAAE
jgi:ABC-2 type transport system ATP-binding protein